MSTPPAPLSDTALRLLQVFPAFQRAFSRWAQSLIETTGVSPARVWLLGVLHCKGPQMMSNLSDELQVTARNVTALVDALEEEDLVRRTAHPTDRRATMVEITPRGTEMAAEICAPFKQNLAGLFRELPEADQKELLRIMEALLNSLRQRDQER